MRSLIAILLGCLIAAIVYWCGAVVALLMMHGIPLGSAGGPPSAGDIGISIALGFMASFLGALLAIKLGRTIPTLHAGTVGLLVGIGAAAGFSKAASKWPNWFGFAIALACLVGALATLLLANRRTGPRSPKRGVISDPH